MDHLLAGLSTRLTTVLGSVPSGHLAALEQLRAIAYREASTMAYADTFRVIMIAFLLTTPLVLLLRKVTGPTASSSDTH